MAIEKRTNQIGERTYQILLPVPTVCLPICNRTVVLLAPVLSGGIGASSSSVSLGGSPVEKMKALLGPALVAMTDAISKADPDAAHKLMMDAVFASHLCCDGEAISDPRSFDKHFSNCRADLYPVLTWTLWECVKDFFPKLEGSPLRTIKDTALSAFLSQMAGPKTGGSDAPAGSDSVPTPS